MEYVKGVTSDHDLIALAKMLHIRLDVVQTIQEVHGPLRGSHIILLGPGESVGHWVALCNGEYFDPTGIGPPTKLGEMPYNQIQYQGTYGEYCGVWCILWLYSKQKNRPDLLEKMNNLDVDFIQPI